MTESMEFTEVRSIHWGGFLIALLAAPALVTAAIQLPLYASDLISQTDALRSVRGVLWMLICIGTGLYFLIGTPVLILHLRHHAPQVNRIVMLALTSLSWIILLGALFALVTFDPAPLLLAAISLVFGLIGAPPLGALFALVYIRLLRA